MNIYATAVAIYIEADVYVSSRRPVVAVFSTRTGKSLCARFTIWYGKKMKLKHKRNHLTPPLTVSSSCPQNEIGFCDTRSVRSCKCARAICSAAGLNRPYEISRHIEKGPTGSFRINGVSEAFPSIASVGDVVCAQGRNSEVSLERPHQERIRENFQGSLEGTICVCKYFSGFLRRSGRRVENGIDPDWCELLTLTLRGAT